LNWLVIFLLLAFGAPPASESPEPAERRREGGRVGRGVRKKKDQVVVVMEARPVCESPRLTGWADDKAERARREGQGAPPASESPEPAERRREGGRVGRGVRKKEDQVVVVMEARPVCESPRLTGWADDKAERARREGQRRRRKGRRSGGSTRVCCCWRRRRIMVTGGRKEGDVDDGGRAGRRRARTRSTGGISSDGRAGGRAGRSVTIGGPAGFLKANAGEGRRGGGGGGGGRGGRGRGRRRRRRGRTTTRRKSLDTLPLARGKGKGASKPTLRISMMDLSRRSRPAAAVRTLF
jgi:hypothetical protein